MCSDMQSDSNCSTIWHIGGVQSYYVQYVPSTAAEYTFASDVSYSNGNYTLVAPFITTWDWPAIYNGINSNHYTCFGNYNSSTQSCGLSVYYINYTSGTTAYYAILKGVANIETALKQMINYGSGANASINSYNSAIKGLIDNWFKINLTNEVDANKTNYQAYLEDAVYCNDRRVTSRSNLGGWLKTGPTASNYQLYFKRSSTSLGCDNLTDRFSADNNNTLANLTYSVGLLSYAESNMMYTGYRRTGQSWWLAAPYNFSSNNTYAYSVNTSGDNSGNGSVGSARGARPAVSLAPDTEMSGEGTYDSPYIVLVS